MRENLVLNHMIALLAPAKNIRLHGSAWYPVLEPMDLAVLPVIQAGAKLAVLVTTLPLPLQLQHPAVAVQHVHQVKFVATGRLA